MWISEEGIILNFSSSVSCKRKEGIEFFIFNIMQKEGGYCIFHLQYHAKGRRVLYFSSSISCKRKEGIVFFIFNIMQKEGIEFFIFNIMQKEGGYCIFHLQYHAKGGY